MAGSKTPIIVVGALVLTALLLGVSVLGGQKNGPENQRDKERLSDLRDLSGFVRCVADREGQTLPAILAPVSSCGSVIRLSDPFTDAPYTYAVLSETEYLVCAQFESAESLPDYWFGAGSFDRTTGCATVPYEPES